MNIKFSYSRTKQNKNHNHGSVMIDELAKSHCCSAIISAIVWQYSFVI